MKLQALIKQERFTSAAQEAILNVFVTSTWLMSEMAAVMAPYGLTPAQYNVLRILRGSHPERLTCGQIGERLLDRTPDVTRLLARLQRMGYIDRRRAEHDRRIVEVALTGAGEDVLVQMQPEVNAAQDRLARHLTDDEMHRLSCLLERLRTDQS